MKRFQLLVAALACVLVFGGPALADFHASCPGAGAKVAGVGLAVDAQGSFTYTGSVSCPGGPMITITQLVLSVYDPTLPGFTSYRTIDEVSGSCSSSPCVLSGTVPGPLLPGFYQVFMRFSVASFHPSRQGLWLWLGVGEPVRTS